MSSGSPHRIELVIGLDEPADDDALRARAAAKLGTSAEALGRLTLVRRSLDARRGKVRFRLLVELGGPPPEPLRLPEPVEPGEEVVIVGAGPAGLFCAWELARRKIPCVVVERGRQVQPRRKDLKRVNQRGEVPEDSNYCFGEGGAGTYSDGKLYTRSGKRGDVDDVLRVLVHCGAQEDILVDARPHIGSNRLPVVVAAMRTALEEAGVRFLFEERVVGLITRGGRAVGVRLRGGESLTGSAVVVATGHSARDVYGWLQEAGVPLEAKPFALGLRVEHPQPMIDRIQFGSAAGHPRLPAAAYRLAHSEGERGVFSFCMCPGGFIVPATTEADAVVVNGMSPSKRGSRFANSGIVQTVTVADAETRCGAGPLAGVRLQQRVEQQAFALGGGRFVAPATRLTDFLAGRASTTVPTTSYQPGLAATDVGEALALLGDDYLARLRRGLEAFGRKMSGYVTEEAVLVGVESRTSAPVRVPRDPTSLEAEGLGGLYPSGEGAGYAGGIVSAALDGVRVAVAIAERRPAEGASPSWR